MNKCNTHHFLLWYTVQVKLCDTRVNLHGKSQRH